MPSAPGEPILAAMYNNCGTDMDRGDMTKHLQIFFVAVLVITGLWIKSATNPTFVHVPEQNFCTDDFIANQYITRCYDLNYFPANEQVVAVWTTSKNGRLLSIKIAAPSEDNIVNFACLEAVSCNAPEPANQSGRVGEWSRSCCFSVADLWKTKSGKTIQYEKHPELLDKALFVYLVPLSVMRKYPTIFSEQELRSPSNVRIIHQTVEGLSDKDITVATQKLLKISDDWADFFSSQKVTRAAILNQASEIEKRYTLACIH